MRATPSPPPSAGRAGFSQVVAVSGHMIDAPGRPVPRFPPDAEPRVTDEIRQALQDWGVGPGTLLLSGGSRGTDIIAAEQALDLEAEVWLLVALPDARFLETSVRLPETAWESRYCALRRRCRTRFQHLELGPSDDEQAVFGQNNGWILAVGQEQAAGGVLRALVVWDGKPGDGPGGTSDFVAQARSTGASVHVIRPGA